MNGKILVAYATRAGSTAEVAQAIGKWLCTSEQAVDVLPVKKVRDLSPYRAVVLGSPIRMGLWLPEAIAFVKKHAARLSEMPTVFFVMCETLTSNTMENRLTVDAYLDPVRAILQPVSVGLFAGVVDASKLNFLERQLLKASKKPEGDFRKWDDIHGWVESLQPIISNC
jgi:menaquinone-dependent protoporphyrinogen oxidase